MELLDKYTETQDKLQSIIVKSRESGESAVFEKSDRLKKPNARMSHEFEFRFDGDRICLRRLKGVFLHPTTTRHRKKNYISRTYDGHYYFRLSIGGTRNKAVVRVQEGEELRKRSSKIITISYAGSEVLGYFWGDEPSEGRRVDSVLRKAETISVRDKMENVGRTECYVIDAVEKCGNYTLWIDPQHGYNIAKAEVFRGAGQLRQQGFTENSSVYSSVRDVRFKKIDDVWVPMDAVTERRSEAFNGAVVWRKVHHKRTEVTLNPDHEALRSFCPDDIPPGAEVRSGIWTGRPPEREGVPDISGEEPWDFRWQPGAKFMADKNCRVVRNDANKHLLPIIKVLDIEDVVEDFKVTPAPAEAKGKRTFLCFWDVKQEGSQQVLLKLRERQEALAQKGVLLIAIEASGAQTDEVRSWAKKNELTFPLGAFYSRFELLWRAWRARTEDVDERKKKMVLSYLVTDLKTLWTAEKLPWLVLTDRNHAVVAEGFSLEELDERIQDAQEAEVVTNKIAHLASEDEEHSSTAAVGGHGIAGGGG
ncbi:MAG: hypothetical protein ACYSUV_11540 [Planctomycetota bacterium]|jgi:hypothetical protein